MGSEFKQCLKQDWLLEGQQGLAGVSGSRVPRVTEVGGLCPAGLSEASDSNRQTDTGRTSDAPSCAPKAQLFPGSR